MANFQSLRLKKNEDRRIKQGHMWVFSNEVDSQATPLKNFTPGEQVVVEASNGKALGLAYVNPNSLICARVFSRDTKHQLGMTFFKKRLQQAQALREMNYDKPYYRLAFGESDGVPGLVIDRFDDVFVVQIGTAGMEAFKDDILQVLINLYHPRAVVWRNDSASRELEGLERYQAVACGELPEQVELIENGVKFVIPGLGGQKTGWFYDHRSGRARCAELVKGKRVLDVFSYLGGWGVLAAVAGASEVACVDASELALDGVHANAELNGVADKVTSYQGNAFEVLTALAQQAEKFDVVIVDPPAFIKRKKDFKAGSEGYRKINQLAMRLVEANGVLVSASCSHHMPREALISQVQAAASHLDRTVTLFDQAGQAPDHPIHPAIPETEYLKTLFFRVSPKW
ncbi:class I SAM-dependent rRNA methyltransferase [Thiomicrospira microaerophila]|uniref:class I SAM-dependent rRNA methyltransferase n=1 Tax=Thiomicrospira microaerophila TaxID=406020 RepID=UPI00200CF694|nr:class I SAM-dependent rRNA methyltransferase [Thiomicrospira microaerophila]UQB41786.1 class I SAM-dependent rRNA methyltransferase [Thiomicrospira microaerophila]